MEFLGLFALETWNMFVLAAPFLLLGLAMAGLVHVLVPTSWIERAMGGSGLGGVASAALVGIPLPICSCGVVPLTVELDRKGASRPASLSFLTTTPESGVDSILFTWALMGPVMAIVRPVAAFCTALLGGAMAIAWLPPETAPGSARAASRARIDSGIGTGAAAEEIACGSCCGSGPAAARTESARSPGSPALPASEEMASDEMASDRTSPVAVSWWRRFGLPSLRYGFGNLFDELAFWLLLGFVLAGLLGAVVPADLDTLGLGSGPLPMLLMLGLGVPLYVCASASTPIAAALMLKGLAPGAALVFLLTGPATNAASLVVLTRTFGRRFVAIYVAGVVGGALLSGFALDLALRFTGLEIALPMAMEHAEHTSPLGLLSALVLVVLFVASARRGALRGGWMEARSSLTALLGSRA